MVGSVSSSQMTSTLPSFQTPPQGGRSEPTWTGSAAFPQIHDLEGGGRKLEINAKVAIRKWERVKVEERMAEMWKLFTPVCPDRCERRRRGCKSRFDVH